MTSYWVRQAHTHIHTHATTPDPETKKTMYQVPKREHKWHRKVNTHPPEEPVQLKAQNVLLQRHQVKGIISDVHLSENALLAQNLHSSGQQAGAETQKPGHEHGTDKRGRYV